MSHPFDAFTFPGLPGRLLFTPCPGTREIPAFEALTELQAAGATAVITLMPSAELSANGVEDMAALCSARGLAWYPLPVADEQVPQSDFDAAWAAHAAAILKRLDAGETLAIHCKGGSGRTGLIAARVLIARGIAREDAVRAVQALRPKAIQHPSHQDWIAQMSV